jgi:(2Fe-2S) ferredoxin
VCRGTYCNLGRRADNFYKQIEAAIREADGDQYPPPIKLETANCMSMCGSAPNIGVFPSAALYPEMTDEKLAAFIEQHIKKAAES